MESRKDPSLWPLAVIGTLFLALCSSARRKTDGTEHCENRPDDNSRTVRPTACDPNSDSIQENNLRRRPNQSGTRIHPWWEEWGAIAQVIIALITAGLLVVNACQIRLTRSALEITRQQFRFDERPWIYGDGHVEKGEAAVKPWTVNNVATNVFFDIPIQFSNVGKTPAVVIATMPVELKMGPKDQIDKQMEDFKPHYSGKPGIGAIPQSLPRPITLATSKERFDVSFEDFGEISRGEWHAFLVGAIQYRDTSQPTLPPYETFICILYNPSGLPIGHAPYCGYMH